MYVGIDVWGRGSHGGGGFGAYRALSHIADASRAAGSHAGSNTGTGTALSTAIFGPAWTWEDGEDAPAARVEREGAEGEDGVRERDGEQDGIVGEVRENLAAVGERCRQGLCS